MLLKHQRTVILVTQKTNLVHHSDYVNILLVNHFLRSIFSISFQMVTAQHCSKQFRSTLLSKILISMLFILFFYPSLSHSLSFSCVLSMLFPNSVFSFDGNGFFLKIEIDLDSPHFAIILGNNNGNNNFANDDDLHV